MKDLAKEFEIYYKKKHNDARFLTWILEEGSIEVTGAFKGKKYIFVTTNFQLIVLQYLNN